MNEFYMQVEARELLEDFESAYSETWFVAQDILKYIENEYCGDRERFLYDVANCCDYFSTAEVLKAVFDLSEK